MRLGESGAIARQPYLKTSPLGPARASPIVRTAIGRFPGAVTQASVRLAISRSPFLQSREVLMSHSPAEHHGKAAYHHESATRHHRAAEKAYGSGDHKTAAHEAQCACGHSNMAKNSADAAANSHMEHHGAQPVEAVREKHEHAGTKAKAHA